MSTNTKRLRTVQSLSWDDCRLLVESVSDYAIFMLDVGGHVASWNVGAQRIKGYVPEEIIGQHFSRFYPPEDVANGKPVLALQVARDVGRFEDEGWRLRKDGTRFWASVVITALRDEKGELRGYGKVTRDLTTRRLADEELRRSEERFRLLVENIGDHAVYVLDNEGRVATWNRGAERMKGYSAAEIVGRSFSVFFPPEDIAAGKPARELTAALATGRYEDEGYRVRKDGSRFWANAILTPLRDAHGAHVGFAKITRDLTARRDAERTARQLASEQAAREAAESAEERLQVILEGVDDGIILQGSDGRLLFANTAAARLTGFDSAEALLRASTADIGSRIEITDEHGERLGETSLKERLALDEDGRSRTALLRVRRRGSSEESWARVRASRVPARDGTPEMTVVIWHDVTAERRREQHAKQLADATAALGTSLDQAEMLDALARSVVPTMADWCTIYVLEGDELVHVTSQHRSPAVQAVLDAFRERFPITQEHPAGAWNVIRTGTSRLAPQIDAADLHAMDPGQRERVEALLATGMRSALLVPLRVRDRVRGALALVSNDERRPYDQDDLVVAEEIGRRCGTALENAQLFVAAQAAARAAEEANRAKDEFLATVSHELRTPLNAIMGWSAILTESVSDPELAKPIATIHRNAQAQGKIIDDILDVARVITGKFRIEPRPTDLVGLAHEAMDVVRPSADAKRIRLSLVSEESTCPLVADPERLQQVVWNLLSNAVKFTDNGGSITLRLRQENAAAVLEVQDTGRGIEAAFLPHVFEQFKQADATTTRRVGGLGLGLALVKHIVELHGGRVTAASEGLGKGSTFRLALPIRAVMPPPAPSAPASEQPAGDRLVARGTRLDGVRILVIDDEPDALELVATVLEHAGAHVHTAGSARDGFDALQRHAPDVIISDVAMPDEDGFSFVRRVRALPASQGGLVPILALTAFRRDEDRKRAVSAGFTAHVGKPVDPEGLAAEVALLAQQRRRA